VVSAYGLVALVVLWVIHALLSLRSAPGLVQITPTPTPTVATTPTVAKETSEPPPVPPPAPPPAPPPSESDLT
jgi:hypothetical protein